MRYMQYKVQLPHPLIFAGKDTKQINSIDHNEMCTTLFLVS